MAKKNVEANKEVVEQPTTDVQPVRKISGNVDVAQTTPEQLESDEKELQIHPGQSCGEQTDDKGNTGMDSEIQETATGEEGGETGDQTVNDNQKPDDETEEKQNRIAKDVFEKNAQCKVLYFTADLIPFFVKSDAIRHGAGKLGNDAIVTINRE
jgi:hypothetical protein